MLDLCYDLSYYTNTLGKSVYSWSCFFWEQIGLFHSYMVGYLFKYEPALQKTLIGNGCLWQEMKKLQMKAGYCWLTGGMMPV